jgi:hypothetical protein
MTAGIKLLRAPANKIKLKTVISPILIHLKEGEIPKAKFSWTVAK